MMAGTSTGSLVTGSLAMPDSNKQNKFYATEVIKVFTEEGEVVFTKPISYGYLAVCWVLFTILGMILGYYLGLACWTSEETEKRIQEMEEKIKKAKEAKKRLEQKKPKGNLDGSEALVKNLLHSSKA
mmetsp:Transcript_17255/g.16459  ORF Transcript_17255/g.16459 Transcript_17255/m.16459 type:complete len:127 (+) Transcript_17255:218-598(+)